MTIKRKFTDEQIIKVMKEIEAGMPVKEACRQNGINDRTYYKWKNRLEGMERKDVQRLKELEAENKKLKVMVAEHILVFMYFSFHMDVFAWSILFV
ncbi:MAG: transposase [Candidatus Omnitrophica bacterium]|nr:transposase [Candidatus Omnitrophota bacterium]